MSLTVCFSRAVILLFLEIPIYLQTHSEYIYEAFPKWLRKNEARLLFYVFYKCIYLLRSAAPFRDLS